MTRRRVLDFSNFSGVPSPDKIAALKAAGWESVILGTQFPSITRQQYQACAAANFPVEALYVFVYWDGEDGRRIAEAAQLAGEFGLKVWLDCEWDKTGYPGTGTWAPPPAAVVGKIHAYRAALGRAYAGIYTGRWWWVPFTNNNQDFSSDPLWHAAYGAVDFEHFPEYGGWTAPQEVRRESDVDIWQFSSGGDQGVNADLNVEEVPEAAMEPTKEEQYAALISLGQFIRMDFNRADLSERDKEVIAYMFNQIPGLPAYAGPV